MVQDLSQFSMEELFRIEAETQVHTLTEGLLALEQDPHRADQLEACMRAAHSLKGAARIVGIETAVIVAHAMEDVFVAAQQARMTLRQRQIDMLLEGVDLIATIAKRGDGGDAASRGAFEAYADRLAVIADADEAVEAPAALPPVEAPAEPAVSRPSAEPAPEGDAAASRALRVSAENLNRLLDLAGESLVESRWVKPFAQSLARLKRMQADAGRAMDALQAALPPAMLDDRARDALAEARRHLAECRHYLSERLAELDASDHQGTTLAHRLYDQALAVRMRPLSDGLGGLARMVRDVARTLGKEARLEVVGAGTQVDRDILEKLEAPLGHLLRNAVDHGLESPDERLAAGKPREGLVRIEAQHNAGMLQISVTDDGRGIDLERIRATVIGRNLANPDMAARLSDSELLEFLFLPGFTMKEAVTEISGRGVGLDVVHDMVKQVHGRVRILPGSGTRFQLELPLTLSVMRALLVEIGGEPYAFPFAHIVRALKIPKDRVVTTEGRQHFSVDGQQVGLITAHQLLQCGTAALAGDELPIILLGTPSNLFGLVVDRFLGGRELVVQPLDPRLGKIKDISAAAVMEDGSPLLIADVEDMVRSMEKLAAGDRLAGIGGGPEREQGSRRKRILVVDDSLTVRELQRKVLDHQGYEVEVAVDGMDGWNALRGGRFDLLVTDIDMPRLDGIELVRRIRADGALQSMPVMILSYKDRDDDRRRGLEAGADYYLTKGNFQDDALLNAVVDLIGEAAEP